MNKKNEIKDKRRLKFLNAVIVTHTLFGWGPGEMLSLYLQNCKELIIIYHPFDMMINHRSYYEIYRDGKKIIKNNVGATHSELLSYVKDFVQTIKIIRNQNKKYDLYVGIDPLNGLAGLFLKFLGNVEKVVFYPIDYNPKRFKNPLLNYLYHKIQIYCAKHADDVWFLAEKILDVFLSKGIDKKKCYHTPIQIEKIYHYEKIEKFSNPTIGYIGTLYPEKGIELIIDSMPLILKSVSNVNLLIIGGGPLENILRSQIKKLRIEDKVTMTSNIPSREKAMELLSKCTIGLAPYLVKMNYYTSYGFGAKVFEYMSCGLPIIITFWEEIEKMGVGLRIDNNMESLSKAAVHLLTDSSFYERCKNNALKIANEHYYERVYDHAFIRLGIYRSSNKTS